MLKFIFSETFLAASISFALPIIFAALAALISNKAGTININIEGSMSLAALAGALTSHFTKSWQLGILAAILVGVVMSLVMGLSSLRLKTDGILSGIALNTMATGLAVVVLYEVLGVQGDTSLAPSTMIPSLDIPFLASIPVIGKVLFSQNLMFYILLVSVTLLWLLLEKTSIGAHIKAVGYNPQAAQAAGIAINKVKLQALILCGALAGLGGAYLSMVYLSYYSVGMVAGRGFIGIAAEAIGAGNPLATALFAWLFGAVDYFAVGAQSVLNVPYELLNTLPNLMTVLALIFYGLKKRKNEIAS